MNLYTRVAVYYLCVVLANSIIAGALFYYWFVRASSTTDQYLHWSIADTLAQELEEIVGRSGSNDEIARLFIRYAEINPRLDPFLLDERGTTEVSLHAPEDLGQVDVAPVRQFLSDRGFPVRPLLGDDPVAAMTARLTVPISSALIRTPSGQQKFVYVVLRSNRSAIAMKSIGDPMVIKASTGLFFIMALFSSMFGAISYYVISKRIHRVNAIVERFGQGDYSVRIAADSTDEIGRLTETVNTMAEKLDSSISALDRADTSRRELMANLSHDMRHPISIMQFALETLTLDSFGRDPAKQADMVDKGMRACRRLSKYVEALFELAKLSDPAFRLNASPFLIGELLEGYEIDYAESARSKQVELHTEISDRAIKVDGDEALIGRVLNNLLANALAYTPAGGSIFLRAKVTGTIVRVSVADTGAGIPKEDLSRIFERFYRSSNSTTTKGTGLGLAIVKRIVELHQSEIFVTSEPGAGTTFSFELSAAH